MSTKPTLKAAPPKTSTKKSTASKAVVEKAPSKTPKVVLKKASQKTASVTPDTEAIHKADIREELFVDAYLADPKLNGTKAAITAGFSERSARSTATILLKNPDIIARIKERQADRASRTEITQDFVLKTCLEVVQRCCQVKPVLDKLGQPVLVETPTGTLAPAFTFDAGNALRGIELLGKHTGTFIDRKEITGKDGAPLLSGLGHFYGATEEVDE